MMKELDGRPGMYGYMQDLATSLFLNESCTAFRIIRITERLCSSSPDVNTPLVRILSVPCGRIRTQAETACNQSLYTV